MIPGKEDDACDRQVKACVDELLEHIRKADGFGWDPYDVRVGKLYESLYSSEGLPGKLLLKVLYATELFAPITYRKLRGIPKTWDPMGNSYYAGAHLSLYLVDGDNAHLDVARNTLDRVAEKAVGQAGKRGFALGFPCITGTNILWSTTVPVAHYSLRTARKFLTWERIVGDGRYASILDETVRFLTDELEWVEVDGMLGVAYTPADPMQVINIWADVASLLACHAVQRGSDQNKERAVRLAESVLAHQYEEGTWSYQASWAKAPYKVDNTHTAMVVGALADLAVCYPEELVSKIRPSLEKGVARWLELFYDESTGANWSDLNNRKVVYSVCLGDTLYAIQRLVRPELGLSEGLVDRLMKLRRLTTEWSLANLRMGDGRFCVFRYPFKKYAVQGVRSFDGLMADALAMFYAEGVLAPEKRKLLWTV